MTEEYFVKQYPIKDIQHKLLEMIKVVDNICKQNDIKYYMDGGTLLGAVRHQGFIPWDDDLDILMMRDDYEKFCKIINKSVDGKYFFEYGENSKDYPNNWGKFKDLSTTWVEIGTKNLNVKKSMFIDIFPMDAYSAKTFAKQRKKLNILECAKDFKKRKVKTFRSLVGKIVYSWNVFFPVSKLNMYAKKVCTMNNSSKNISSVYKFSHANNKQKVYDLEIFNDFILLDFENIKLPAPIGYKEFLKLLFGENYMDLPPKELRATDHHLLEVKL